MENGDLFGVLESLLAPAVAGMGAPSPRRRARAAGAIAPDSRPQGSVAGLLADAPVGMAVLDAASLRVRRANAALLSLFDVPWHEREAIGRPIEDLAPGLAESEVDLAFHRVGRTGQPFSAVIELEHEDGSMFLRCTLSPIRDAAGRFDELLMVLLDVTGQMEAQRAAEREAPPEPAPATTPDPAARRAAVRAFAADALAREDDLGRALDRIAAQVATLGDCCALAVLGEDDVLHLWALAHRDPARAAALLRAYEPRPLRRGEGMLGQVVLNGDGLIAPSWGPEAVALIAPDGPGGGDEAGIQSAVCAPLRAAGRTFGALLLYALRAEDGGSGLAYEQADGAALQEVADQVALAAQGARLREALRVSQGEKEALLEVCGEGIAIYDAHGRLRHLNAAGRQLLSRPDAPVASVSAPGAAGRAAARRTLRAADGHELTPEELPWTRALRGEEVGAPEPERLVVEWASGARRELRARAAPVRDGAGGVIGAAVALEEAPPVAPSPAPSVADAEPVAQPDAPAMPPDDAGPAPAGAVAGTTEWARWRETMELLDDGVVLCDAAGAPVFANTAGRALLGLPRPADGADGPADGSDLGGIWEHLRRPDGSPLAGDELPIARALVGVQVRELETGVELPGGAVRRVYWDARRIDAAGGAPLGVVLIARAAGENGWEGDASDRAGGALLAGTGGGALPPTSSPDAPLVGATTPSGGTAPGGAAALAAMDAGALAPTLAPAVPTPPGGAAPAAAEVARTPGGAPRAGAAAGASSAPSGEPRPGGAAAAAPAPPGCDLAEACARVARGHGGAQGRRLEIRLPRRRVLVAAGEDALEAALDALIAAGAAALPGSAPLHLAVWVEHAGTDLPPGAPVPPAAAGQPASVRLGAERLPSVTVPLAPPARAGATAAIVRICSPSVRAPLAEPEQLARCRALAEGMGGQVWAREDPILGPTYSLSLPLAAG